MSHNLLKHKWEGENIYTSQYAPLEIVKLADIGYSGVSGFVTLHGAAKLMKRIRRRSSGDIVMHSIDNEICLKSTP
jgi:hypothetical protein